MNYVATHPDAVLTYNKNNMIMAVHSGASYLTEPKSRSRARGPFFLSRDAREPENSGPVLNTVQIIKRMVTSAAEAETGTLFINTRNVIPARYLLEGMGHKQSATPVQTDNITVMGCVTKTSTPSRQK